MSDAEHLERAIDILNAILKCSIDGGTCWLGGYCKNCKIPEEKQDRLAKEIKEELFTGPSEQVDAKNELIALRNVYESARALLRYNGIDKERADAAYNQLGDDIEVVKELDGGLVDDDFEVSARIPRDDVLEEILSVLENPMREYHAQAMGCGLEDRGITDKYEAMQYGYDEAVDRAYDEIITPAIEAIRALKFSKE